jgi:hypothetical protein
MAHRFNRFRFQRYQNLFRTLCLQVLCQLRSHQSAIIEIPVQFIAYHAYSILAGDKSAQPQHAPADFGEASQRHLATATQCATHGALGFDTASSGNMMQRFHEFDQIGAICAALNPQSALPHCGQAEIGA